MNKNIYGVLICVIVSLLLSAQLLAQSGGAFAIEQSLMTPGGGNMSGGPFAAEVSNAQPTAHPGTNGGPFAVTSGFWNPLLPPTAANVSISGRVMSADGRGLPSAIVLCVDAAGNSRSARTSSLGYYHVADIQAGTTYIFYVQYKGFSFESRVVTVVDEVSDLDFIAQ